mgnify:CR=1 FL=1
MSQLQPTSRFIFTKNFDKAPYKMANSRLRNFKSGEIIDGVINCANIPSLGRSCSVLFQNNYMIPYNEDINNPNNVIRLYTSSQTGTPSMAQYKFKRDVDATGTNIVPAGSKMANFQLKYNFKKGDIFEGYQTSEMVVTINTNSALNVNGTPVTGKARFGVPLSELEEVKAETPTDGGGLRGTKKDNTIYYVIGAVVLIGGIIYFATRKPETAIK